MTSYKQIACVSARKEACDSTLIFKLLVLVSRVRARRHLGHQVYPHHSEISHYEHQTAKLRVLNIVRRGECGLEKIDVLLRFFALAGKYSVRRHGDLLERDNVQLLTGPHQRGEYLLRFPFRAVARYYLKVQLSVRLLTQLF